MTRYLPVGGTGHGASPWVTSDEHPFALFMKANDFEPLRPGGLPWCWSGNGLGLWFFGGGDREWRKWAGLLGVALEPIAFEYRNLFCHSNGGQLAIILAAQGFPLRTLTTFGTPNRQNLPSVEAAKYIDFWQHVYDNSWDWMASLRRGLGQIGDYSVKTDRTFAQVPSIRRVPLDGISHSYVLNDPAYFHLLNDHRVLEGVRTAGACFHGAS